MKRTLLALALMTIWTGLSQAQGTFQNLNFESAQLIFESPTFPLNNVIATTNAVPGWTAFSGTTQLSAVPYNGGNGFLFDPVELIGMGHGEISGNFSVLLSNGYSGTNSAGSITQTGLVPTDAQSLLFKFEMYSNSAPGNLLAISLGGQDLSYVAISNALNYTLYGADVSSFSGKTETLDFSATGTYGAGWLDNIQFSQVAIPEPSTISLICLGSGVLFYVRKRKRS